MNDETGSTHPSSRVKTIEGLGSCKETVGLYGMKPLKPQDVRQLHQ